MILLVMIVQREELTAAERERMQHEKDMYAMQNNHIRNIKELELELATLEARWSSWLRIPITILKLPLYVVLGVAYCIAAGRKYEPPEAFWQLLK